MVDPKAIRALIALGTPGMGLVMIPLGIGICLLLTGACKRWANLLVWGSVAALGVGVLNSIRISLAPTTIIVMIAIGAGLMLVIRRDDDDDDNPGNRSDS